MKAVLSYNCESKHRSGLPKKPFLTMLEYFKGCCPNTQIEPQNFKAKVPWKMQLHGLLFRSAALSGSHGYLCACSCPYREHRKTELSKMPEDMALHPCPAQMDGERAGRGTRTQAPGKRSETEKNEVPGDSWDKAKRCS